MRRLFAIGFSVFVSAFLLIGPLTVSAAEGDPVITSVTPGSVVKTGGDSVTISGEGFAADATVLFRGISATSLSYVDETTIVAVVPAGLTGAADVVVRNGDGGSFTLTGGLTYVEPPLELTGVTPTSGPMSGGQAITIQGNGFVQPGGVDNVWTSTGKTIATGYGAQLAVVGSKMYMYRTTIYTADVSDPTTWTSTEKSLPVTSNYGVLYIINDVMYFLTGANNAILTASTSDPTTWTNTGKTLPAGAEGRSFAQVGNTLYLYGGLGSAVVYSASVSEPTTWTNTGKTLPGNMAYSQVVTIGQTMYMFGSYGSGATNAIYSASVSDPTTWTNTGKTLPFGVGAAQLVVIGGDMCLYGGVSSNVIQCAKVSDPTTWSDTGKRLPVALYGSQAAVIDDKVYLLGGSVNTIFSMNAGNFHANTYNRPWSTNWTTHLEGSAAYPGDYRVSIGGQTAQSVRVVSDTQLQVTTPTSSTKGLEDLLVTGYDGQSATLPGGYEYIAGPVAYGISPASGIKFGGDTVTITGENFTEDTTVTFDGIEGIVTNRTATTLTVVTPAHSPVPVDVVVKDSLGQKSTLTKAFTYVEPAPAITSITPSRGPAEGGQEVTITGENFVAGENEFVQVSAGTFHSLALDSDGKVYSWGYNGNGQLGNNSTTQSLVPVAVNTSGVLAGKTIVAVAAGGNHSLALDSDGKVYSWGYNSEGELGNSSTTGSLVPVAVNTSGVLAGKTIVAVAAGTYHSLAVDNDGKVYSWGHNYYGQLGNNSTTQSTVPVAVNTTGVLAGKTISTISAGNGYSLALDSNGKVYGWGVNSYGQLGNSSTTGSLIPVAVNTTGALSGKTIVAVAAADSHPLAVDGDGKVYSWGYNNYGKLGNNSTANSLVPVASINPAQAAPRVTIGGLALTQHRLVSSTTMTAKTPAHTAGLKDLSLTIYDGQSTSVADAYEYVAGPVAYGISPTSGIKLGGDTTTITGENFTEDTTVTFDGISADVINQTATTVTVITPAGAIGAVDVVVEDNLGQKSTLTKAFTYVEPAPVVTSITPSRGPAEGGQEVTITGENFVPGESKFSQIAGGYEHSCGLTEGGEVYCWGLNANGQLGNNSTAQSNVPVAVDTNGVLSGKTIVRIAAGGSSSLALDSDGKVYSWGSGGGGQLGNNSTTQSLVPVAVTNTGALSGKRIVDIATSNGASSSLALDSDGKVYSWGRNNNGQLGNNSTTQSLVPVAVNTSGVLAGKTIVGIAAGLSYSLALDSDGKVYSWGYNNYGQLGNNSTTQSLVPVAVNTSGVLAGKTIVGIAAGYYHSLAFDADGKVYGWGTGTNGRLGNNSVNSTLVPVAVTTTGVLSGEAIVGVAAGASNSLALDSGGKVYGWGSNGKGQLGNNSTADSSVPVSAASIFFAPPALTLGGLEFTNIRFVSDTTLTAKTPARSAGKVDLTVTNYDGQAATLSDAYEYITPPAATNISPASGVKFGGDTVTISGSHFTEGNSVRFGGVAASIINQTATTITVVTPAGLVGAVDVTVTDSLGQVSTLANAFTYREPTPILTSITPTRGPASGGQSVTIGGSGFGFDSVDGDGDVALAANGATATASSTYTTYPASLAFDNDTSTYWWSSTSAPAWVQSSFAMRQVDEVAWRCGGDSGAATNVTIELLVNGNWQVVKTLTNAQHGTIISGDAVGSYTLSVPVNATAIRAYFTTSSYWVRCSSLSAYSHQSTPTPRIDGEPLSGAMVGSNGTQLTGVTAARPAGLYDVTVETSDGQIATLLAAYEYVAEPTITGISPESGSVAGGDTIVISGSNFSSNSTVTIGGIAATILGYTPTSLTVSSPVNKAGTYDVVVSDEFGQKDVLADAFTYRELAPILTSITPTRGPVAGGQDVTISGSNFVMGESKFTQVVAGSDHSCGLIEEGGVYCWGANSVGQLGNNSTTNSLVPVEVTTTGVLSGKTIVSIAAGYNHSLAIDSDGKVYGWGNNSNGQLGNNSTTNSLVPVEVTTTGVLSGKTITSVAVGAFHSLALDSDGKVYGWGNSANGQLGYNSTTQSLVPVAVATTGVLSGKTIVNITAGSHHALAIDSSGKIYSWGSNSNGQLGNNSTTQSLVPVAVNTSGVLAGKTIVDIAAGAYHSLALDSDGKAYGWGFGNYGQLGNNSTTSSLVPVAVNTSGVLAGKKIVGLAAGTAYYSLALDSDGKAYGWGYNGSGRLGNNSTTSSIVPINTEAVFGKVPTISLGESNLTDVKFVSDTTLTAKTPAHSAGKVDLTVTNYDGQAATLSDAYEYVAAPTITSVTPASGSIAGGNSVYVNGTGFTEQTTIKFGASTALTAYINATTLLVVVPASAIPGEVSVTVTDEFGQTGTRENAYTYQLPAPTMTSIAPVYSKMGGGGVLTIRGTGFVSKTGGGSWYSLTIDGAEAANVTVVDSTTITATLPAHAPGKVDVTLGGQYSEAAVLSGGLTYLPDAYAFTNEPRSVMATEPAQLTVEARDSEGQLITSTEDIVLQLSTSANTGAFARALTGQNAGWDQDTIIIPAGQSSATFYYRDSQEGTATITARDALETAITQQVTILSRYKLLVTGITSPTNVGVPSSITIQAVDYTGIAQTDYRGTIGFTSTDGAASVPANYTFTASDYGRRTFTNGVTFGTQGVWDVTVTDTTTPTITGAQSQIVVGPPAEGEIAQLRFITSEQSFPLSETSGVMTVQLQDTTGVPVVASSDTVVYARTSSSTGEFSIDSGATWHASPMAITIAENHSSINLLYRDTSTGEHTLKVSQLANSDFGWGIARQQVTVGVGAPSGIQITAPVSSPIGMWVPVEVGMRDDSGNSVSASNDTILKLATSENARYSLVATGEASTTELEVVLTAGQRSVTVYVQATAGSEITLTATDARPLPEGDEPYVTGTATILLGSAEPAGLILSAPSESIRVQDAHAVAVSLKDQFGNIVMADVDTDVTFSANSSDGQYANVQSGAWSSSLTKTIPVGVGSAHAYFKHTTVKNDVTLEASANELTSATWQVNVIAGVYSGKIRFEPTNTATTPASVPTTIVAGQTQQYTVQPIDAWGNPTIHTSPIEIGLGGSTGATATWSGAAVTNPTNPAQAATKVTIPAGEAGATATYRNAVSGVASITAWDTASWEQYCVDGAPTGVGDGYICYTYGYRNNSKIQEDISIVADAPVGYGFETDTQVVAKNTASQPIIIQLVDQFGNETSFKAGEPSHSLNLQSSSVTGEFSLSADNWQAISEISFEPSVSQATVYYRDATVSTVEGHTLSTAGSLTAASQTIRIVEGFAAKAELDLDGQTTAVAGDYLPVTLRSTTSDGLEVVVLRDTSFALSGGQAGEFYTYNEANATYSPITSVVLPAERSNKIVYYRATVTGEKTLRAAASGFSAGMAEISVLPNVIQKLEYTQIPAGAARVEVTRASGGYAATTQDVFGNVVIADASAVTDIDVTSSHPTGEFSTSQQGGWGIATVPIPAGASTTQTFYYRNGAIDEQTGNLVDATALGEQTLTAHLDGVEDAEATITVVGLIATKIEFTSQSHTVVAGQKSEKVAVKLLLNEDGVDKPAVSTTDRTFAITSHESQSAHLFAGTYGKDMFTNENGDEITHVTIPAGSSTAHFYVTPKTAGSHRIQVSGAIYNHSGVAVRVVSAFQSISVLHAEPSQLVVRSAPQTLHPAWDSMPDEVSEPIKVVLADEFGNPATESSNRTISVASSCESGEFLASPTGAAVQSITLTAGHSEAFAYYKDTESHAEPCTLIFSSSDVANGAQEIIVRERVFEFVMTSQEQTVEAGQESQPIQVESRDRFGNAVTVEQAQTLRFSVTGEGNVLTPISATIPAGGTTATFTFRHTAAVGAEASYTVTATDQAGRIRPASQVITVVPGVAARLSWEQSTMSTTVGEYAPVRITVLNAYNMATSATSSITTSLTTDAGTNSATGQPAGEFYVKSTGDTYTPVSSVTIEQGARQKLVYYRQTTTTKTRSLERDISGVIASNYGVWRESDAQKQIIRASAPGLVAVDGLVSVSPHRLGFSTGNFSAQARAFTPLKVTISGPLPQDLTVNLSSSTAGEGAGFYSTNTGSTDEAIAGDRITSIVIPAGQTESATIYYRQDSLGGDYVNRPVQLNAEPLNAPWSTWSGQVYASMYLGAVSQIVITDGPDSLEQGETGTYSFETRDNLGNPVALVPYQPGYADRLQSPPACLYVRVGSTEPTLTGSPGSNCAAPAGKDVAVISMKAGAKSGTFTYSDAVVGPHTVTVANSASGNSTLLVQKQVDITPAITTQVSFDKPQYALVRGDTINSVTVQLMSSYGRQVNTKGEVEVLITTTSATGLFKNPETGDWQEDLTVLIPAGQSSVGISYRDDSAPLGQATLSASAPSLQSGSAKVSLVTGNFSSVRFAEAAQTLKRQQEGVFEIVTTDASGNEVPALTNMCFYITVPSPTATVSAQSTSSCQNVTLPGGATAHALYVASGTSRASFTLTDSNVGIYDISVSTQPTGGGVTVAQEVTIVDGDPVAGVFKDAPYRLERGGIVAPRLVLHNAFGAEVPAVKDMYFQLSSSSVTGQFAHATDDTWSQTKRLFMAQGESQLALLYGDSEPIIDEYTLTAREVTGSGEGIDPAAGGLEDVDAPVFIVYGAPVQLIYTTPERTTIATHPSERMTVTLQNQYGFETITETDLRLYVRSTSQAGSFATTSEGSWGVTTITIPANDSSTEVYYRDKTEGVHTITVRDSLTPVQEGQPQGLAAAQDHEIVRQTFDHFVVTNIATPQKAGLPSSVVVFAVDSEGYVVEWYDGTIRFSSDSSDAIYPTDTYTLKPETDKGIHTFVNSVAFTQPGVKSVTVSDATGKNGTQYDIVVTAGNEAPVREIAIISPEVQPAVNAKNIATEQITIQLRDSVSAPTNTTIASGYPVRLTTNSPTGRFATSPQGPWTTSLVTTVPTGLSFSTTPIYYRDSASGSHLITATDWVDATDNSLVANDELSVIVPEVEIESNAKIYAKNYKGDFVENAYLFAHTSRGSIAGYATLGAQARDLQTGDAVVADWTTSVYQGSTLVDESISAGQVALDYRTPILDPVRGSDSYTITSRAESEFADGAATVNVPVSPWLAAISQVGYDRTSGIVNATLVTTKNADATDSLQATIFVPSSSGGWSLADLIQDGHATRIAAGVFQLRLPVGQLPVGASYVVASLNDGIGITAQDSVEFEIAAVDVAQPSVQQPSLPGGFELPAVAPEEEVPTDDGRPSGGGNVQPSTPAIPGSQLTDNSLFARIMRSPATPVAVAGALLGIVVLIAALLVYQAYKEWHRAKWLMAIIKKNQRTVADKNSFLQLASHHLRTPMTLIRASIEMLASNPAAAGLAQSMKVTSDQLYQKIEQIVEETNTSADLAAVTATDTKTARVKILASPIFWLPVILSIVLTIACNWLIATYGGQAVGGTVLVNQVLFMILAAVVLYTAVRQLAMRRERREQLEASRQKVDILNKAKINFAQRVQAGLSDDILRVGGYAQEASLIAQGPVSATLSEGAERLKQLVSRFAVLTSIYSIAPVPRTFEVEFAVDDAIQELSRGKDLSRLQVEDHTAHLALNQDRRLVTKLFETVIASMAPHGQSAKLVIDGTKEKDGSTTVRITGAASDEVPAENLFSVYSRADQEEAGTMRLADDQSMQRLDLYLDRLIVDSLGGDIDAKKSGGRMSVRFRLPALR